MINKTNILGYFIIISFLILFVDLPFALLVNYITSDDVRQLFSFITKLAEPISLIIMTFIIYGYHYIFENRNIKELWLKFLIQMQVIVYGSLVIQALKYILGRYRLKSFFETGDYGFSFMNSFGYSNSSFPSGHSSIIFIFVTTVMLLFPIKSKKIRISVYLFASVVAFSRIMVNAHYMSDVIVGSCLGYILSVYAFNYKKNELSK